VTTDEKLTAIIYYQRVIADLLERLLVLGAGETTPIVECHQKYREKLAYDMNIPEWVRS